MKEGIKRIIDYTLTYEFKVVIMVVMSCLIILFFIWNMLLISVTEDLTQKIDIQTKETEELSTRYDDLQREYNYLRSFNDELVDNLKYCEGSSTK